MPRISRPKIAIKWDELDPIALLALIISLATGSFQIITLLLGPKVEILPPDLIEFTQINGHLIITAGMIHVNKSSRNDILRREAIRFSLPGQGNNADDHIQLTWQYLVTPEAKDGFIGPKIIGTAIPMPIEANGSISHEYQFYPREITDQLLDDSYYGYISFGNFIAQIESLSDIKFELIGEYVHSSSQSSMCRVEVDERFLHDLRRASNTGEQITRVCH